MNVFSMQGTKAKQTFKLITSLYNESLIVRESDIESESESEEKKPALPKDDQPPSMGKNPQRMKKMQSQSTSNPASISQYAAAAALNGDQSCIKTMVTAFKERHDYLVDALNSIDGIDCVPGDGTFYAFAQVDKLMAKANVSSDVELCEKLLTEANVALVPGSAFGTGGYCRLSFATGMDVLKEAVKRIKSFSESL